MRGAVLLPSASPSLGARLPSRQSPEKVPRKCRESAEKGHRGTGECRGRVRDGVATEAQSDRRAFSGTVERGLARTADGAHRQMCGGPTQGPHEAPRRTVEGPATDRRETTRAVPGPSTSRERERGTRASGP
ncbi:hypothetical protein M885DRAFT_292731 [Pelagophyceae sp. CCMP2097]|nr:hypothetical protein M885DRAFT_292731 [Pelagophyceae sp. CCMP2097]